MRNSTLFIASALLIGMTVYANDVNSLETLGKDDQETVEKIIQQVKDGTDVNEDFDNFSAEEWDQSSKQNRFMIQKTLEKIYKDNNISIENAVELSFVELKKKVEQKIKQDKRERNINEVLNEKRVKDISSKIIVDNELDLMVGGKRKIQDSSKQSNIIDNGFASDLSRIEPVTYEEDDKEDAEVYDKLKDFDYDESKKTGAGRKWTYGIEEIDDDFDDDKETEYENRNQVHDLNKKDFTNVKRSPLNEQRYNKDYNSTNTNGHNDAKRFDELMNKNYSKTSSNKENEYGNTHNKKVGGHITNDNVINNEIKISSNESEQKNKEIDQKVRIHGKYNPQLRFGQNKNSNFHNEIRKSQSEEINVSLNKVNEYLNTVLRKDH